VLIHLAGLRYSYRIPMISVCVKKTKQNKSRTVVPIYFRSLTTTATRDGFYTSGLQREAQRPSNKIVIPNWGHKTSVQKTGQSAPDHDHRYTRWVVITTSWPSS